jgi:3D (Asp-Asp-Asp) domain-containing protein
MNIFAYNPFSQRIVALSLVIAVIGSLIAPRAVKTEVIDAFKPLVTMFSTVPQFPMSGAREPAKTLTVAATAYSSDPYQTDSTPCIDASGRDICERAERLGHSDIIAANFLPKGTKVRFPELYGNKVFIVSDRMNARYNYHVIGYYRVDFYTAVLGKGREIDADASRQAARSFGFKRGVKMEVF